eukprot:4752048-Amphidinium_carterae.1
MSTHLAPKTGHQVEDKLSPVAQMYMTNVVLPNRPPGLNLWNERDANSGTHLGSHHQRAAPSGSR